MIPTLLIVGLLAGRWYVAPLAAVVWPLILVVAGITSEPAALLVGSGLALVNTAIGVLVHKAVLSAARNTPHAFRLARRGTSS